ncbi:MAG: T9SS type A sorting domain-containing protein, partial [Bacteroidota bacterium]
TEQSIVLPPLDMEPGVHVLEVYLEEGETLNPSGIAAQFVGKTTAPILQEMEQEALTYDAFKVDDECPCLKHVDEKAPLASFWYYLVKTDVGDDMLFYAYGEGQNWEPATTIQGTCAAFVVQTPQGPWTVGTEVPLSQRVEATPEAPATQEMAIAAYPNPFDDYVDLEISLPATQPITIEVIEAGTGRQIYLKETHAQSLNQMMRVKTHQWASGLYLLTLTQGDHSQSIKLIKTH